MRQINLYFTIFITILANLSFLQAEEIEHSYQSAFESAYNNYLVPRGVLESVAFNNTRIRNLQPETDMASCTGLPFYQGVMGLIGDGHGYFRENLDLVADLSGFDKVQIANDPVLQIQAYAAAWEDANLELPSDWSQTQRIVHLFELFSEIPMDTNRTNNFALNSQLYVYFLFLNDAKKQAQFNFPNYNFDLEQIFGANNLKVLSAKGVQIGNSSILSNTGHNYQRRRLSSDYPPAIWDPTTCNFNSRSGVAVTAVTIHTIQGSYAGAISWFKNCNANVSAHYVLRSVDGQVTQVVSEADRAWHVGTENSYTIGLEHEGYVSDSSWYTAAMYNSSANLVKDIVSDYGMNPHSTYRGTSQTVLNQCYRIKGHIHYPNQTHTDPGVYWDWEFYHYLINNPLQQSAIYTSCNGSISDTTGSSDYGSLERYYQVIDPGTNGPLTLSFTAFDTEQNYDFLYVYDGDNIQAPLLATLSGSQIPADIIAPSGKMTLLFDSDCLYNGTGWEATWECTGCSGNITVQLDSIVKASCGGQDGLLEVSAQGGTAPYTFEWSNGVQNKMNGNLAPGLYSLTIHDDQGCFAFSSFVLSSDSILDYNRVLEHSKCFGDNDGEVAFEIVEGLAPFSYNWSNGASSFFEKDLAPGTYSVSISDARNCLEVDTFTIDEAAAPLRLDSINSTYLTTRYQLSPKGYGGGTPPYTFNWNTGDNTSIITVEESGVYVLEIIDDFGCSVSAYVKVDFPTSIDNPDAADLKIYPVPFKEQLNIQGIHTDEMQISIHNTLGQSMYQSDFGSGNLQISTANWANGVYFVYLLNEEGSKVLSRKVLKY